MRTPSIGLVFKGLYDEYMRVSLIERQCECEKWSVVQELTIRNFLPTLCYGVCLVVHLTPVRRNMLHDIKCNHDTDLSTANDLETRDSIVQPSELGRVLPQSCVIWCHKHVSNLHLKSAKSCTSCVVAVCCRQQKSERTVGVQYMAAICRC